MREFPAILGCAIVRAAAGLLRADMSFMAVSDGPAPSYLRHAGLGTALGAALMIFMLIIIYPFRMRRGWHTLRPHGPVIAFEPI